MRARASCDGRGSRVRWDQAVAGPAEPSRTPHSPSRSRSPLCVNRHSAVSVRRVGVQGLTCRTGVLHHLPSRHSHVRSVHEGRVRARHSPEIEGGDEPTAPPEDRARPDRPPRRFEGEAHGRRPLPWRFGSGGRDDPGAGGITAHERRRAGRGRAALLPGLRSGAQGSSGVSDRVEEAELGTAYVRIDGLEGVYRGEAGVVSALLNAVPAYLRPRLAVAGSKFPAYVAARTSRTHGASRVPENVAAFLAPYPVELLPIPSKMKTAMRRFGLYTMGRVASLGERRLTDRFGLEGRRAWRLCNGTDDEAIHPMAFVETVVERMSLSFSTSLVHALSLAVDTLLRRAYARPEMRGRYAGMASLRCAATGWPSWERRISRRQLGERIACRPEQAGVGPTGHSRGGGDAHPIQPDGRARDPDGTLRRPAQGPGAEDSGDGEAAAGQAGRVQCAVQGGEVAPWLPGSLAPWHPAPEIRALQVPVDPSAREAVRPLHSPEPVEVREGTEGEPVSVLYRRRWRHVSRIDDRWMFDLWWLPKPVTRSYYRIDPGDGRLLTLFRDHWDERWYRQSA